MTHLTLRKYLTGLIALGIVIAFFKLAFTDWAAFMFVLSTSAGILLQWAVTKENNPSVKNGDE